MTIGFKWDGKDPHPEFTCIMLDYDVKDWRKCTHRISRAIDSIRPYVKDCLVHRTRKGWHVRIWIDFPLSPRRLNDLQSWMGDDEARVRMNERRIKKGIEPWNRLWLMKFKLDGTIISREVPAPGATKQLKEMLMPSDRYFRRMRTNGIDV
jgi:hypothetical protein